MPARGKAAFVISSLLSSASSFPVEGESIFKSHCLFVHMAPVSGLTLLRLHFSHFASLHTFDWASFVLWLVRQKDRRIIFPHLLFNHCLLLLFLFLLSLWLSLFDSLTKSVALPTPLSCLCFDSHILIAYYPISGINEIFIHVKIYQDLKRLERSTETEKKSHFGLLGTTVSTF